MSDKFALRRGSGEPMIWPFASEEEAQDWALDHGCLDWDVERMADRPEHAPYCGRCSEAWPCEHVRLDRRAAVIIHASANACARCGKRVGWKEVRVKGGGSLGEDIKFHGRQGACRKEGLRRLEALGTDEARAELKRLVLEQEYDRQLREHIAAEKAQQRERLLASLREES